MSHALYRFPLQVRDTCSIALVALGPAVKAKGRAAIEAHKLLVGLETSNPRIYKKLQAALEGAPATTSATGSGSGVGAGGGATVSTGSGCGSSSAGAVAGGN